VRRSRDAGRLCVRGEDDAAVILRPEEGGEVFPCPVYFGLAHAREGQVDLLVTEDFELTLGTEAGVNLDKVLADGGLTPCALTT
jgi:hypothetical protein